MIIIDAGHGGSDPGASSGDIIEKEYTLKIADYIYNRLKELDIPTVITRDTDITLNPKDRIDFILSNISGPNDLVISNHLNAGGRDGQSVINNIKYFYSDINYLIINM